MTRHPFLLTLYAGTSTKEVSYGPDRRGEVAALDESEWDGPISLIERVEMEILSGPGAGKRLTLTGLQYQLLEEAEAIEGLFAALSKGKRPTDALAHAMALADVLA